ncbi:hypothetical protein EFL26_05790 [Nocardioides pocheonensis]|uniref:Big-1 domain-containing protein n=1 Tax=Nocardioides pocheonensis TaxID=661485 RepID=A0A3N0GVV1_9ACTN|nr:hypothetical protein EFL26_05790 [Nocardioides pocheonensis]
MVVLMMLCVSPALPAVAAGADPTEVFPIVVDDLSGPVAGKPLVFAATLVDSGAPAPGEVLSLWVQPSGSADFTEVGQATTNAAGTASLSTVLDRNAMVQWRFGGSSARAASSSTPYVVEIAPALTRRANDLTLRRGQRLVVRGRTSPAKPGCAVELWRGELRPLMVGPKPVRLARSTVRADGSYRLTRRFHRHLRARIAVVIPACGDNGRGLSAYLGLRVR